MPKTRVEIAKAAEYLGHWQGSYVLTEDDLDRIVSNWRGDVVIDYEHASHSPDAAAAPAAGWVTSVTRDGTVLYGEVMWTDRATGMIDADEYRYLSPVFDLYALDANSGNPIGAKLVSVGLTNTPFMDDLEGVRNTKSAKGELTLAPVSRGLVRNTFRNPDTPTDPEPMAGSPNPNAPTFAERILNRVKTTLGITSNDEFEVAEKAREVVQNAQRVPQLEADLKAANDALAAEKEAATQLRQQVEQHEAATDELLLNSAVTEFKIKSKEREDYEQKLRADRPGTRAILNALPKDAVKPDAVKPEAPADAVDAPSGSKRSGDFKTYIKNKRKSA